MSPSPPDVRSTRILGVRVDATSYTQAIELVRTWTELGESRIVCTANVHMLMTAYDDAAFRGVMRDADLVTPDGMPLVWTLRRIGYAQQERVYGPTLTCKLLSFSEEAGIPVGFLGSTPAVIENLQVRVKQAYPQIKLDYAYSPPFRVLDSVEDAAIVEAVNRSGVRILFVGLGCPKQELWMHAHRGKVNAVMLGVGAAFDYLAGVKPQAPLWVQRIGMEWFYRLVTEPKRLWKRYMVYNPRFAVAVTWELLTRRHNQTDKEI
jgi:N-acetylglucosaminyldiphosphoundecaprenol N-acetyl-beta-D-mannosaminyltransferase